jgi:phage I-like protein
MIKSLLMDQKFFQAVADVDTLMQAQGIDENCYVQGMTFEKKAFKDKSEVVEWLAKYGYQHCEVIETDSEYVINLYTPGTFDEIIVIDIRRGVQVVIGKITPSLLPYSLSLKNDKDDIKFNDKLPSWIELAKVVEGTHRSYGKVKITEDDLAAMNRNFKDGVVGVDIMIDFDHAQAEAAGWLKETKLTEDGKTLLGLVKWTPKGSLSLSNKEFRYFSPEFNLNYVHPHTGKSHGPTLLGGGLVNRPFLKMDAIVEMSEHSNKGKAMDVIKMSEHKAKVEELETKLAEKDSALEIGKDTIKKLQEKNTQLSDELKTIKEDSEKKDYEAKVDKLFSENKINAAQLKAMKEKRVSTEALEVIAMSEGLNTKPAGNGNDHSGNNGTIVLTEEEKAACKLFDLTEAEYIKANY